MPVPLQPPHPSPRFDFAAAAVAAAEYSAQFNRILTFTARPLSVFMLVGVVHLLYVVGHDGAAAGGGGTGIINA